MANAPELYTSRTDSYLRFIRAVGYAGGLAAAFRQSPVLLDNLRVLDAGCGTGVTSFALGAALKARGMSAAGIDAFDLTPAMLDRFRAALPVKGAKEADDGIGKVHLARADVLQLQDLPDGWEDYDLVITASMLEYIEPREFTDALRGLGGRLREGGSLMLFITRNNALMRLLIGRWWSANLYTQAELRRAFAEAGFAEVTFLRFPFPYGYLNIWGHIVLARPIMEVDNT